MFMQLETTKNEKIIVGVNKILLIAEGKKGATFVLIDGTPITVKQNFEELTCRLNRRELLFELHIEDYNNIYTGKMGKKGKTSIKKYIS